jgi:hypothetical protein
MKPACYTKEAGPLRGLHFEDSGGQVCGLRESSAANVDGEGARVWFGLDGHPSMSLSQERVLDLLPALRAFARTGRLPKDAAKQDAPESPTRPPRGA